MQVLWPEKVKSHFRVYHPINSGGTTWLRESDLVFVHKRPYAVLSWSHTNRGDVPEKFCELNRKLLKHDRPAPWACLLRSYLIWHRGDQVGREKLRIEGVAAKRPVFAQLARVGEPGVAACARHW